MLKKLGVECQALLSQSIDDGSWSHLHVSPCVGPSASAAAQDIALGVKVYDEERCALCHSIGDDGNKKGPLDGVGSRLSAEDIERWMLVPKEMTEETGATRRPFMPAYPKTLGRRARVARRLHAQPQGALVGSA